MSRTVEKSITNEGWLAYTVRLSPEAAAWLNERVEKGGRSANAILRQMVDDIRGFFGLPAPFADPLRDDAKAMGLSTRDYILHLLAKRYEQVIREGPGFEKKGARPAK